MVRKDRSVPARRSATAPSLLAGPPPGRPLLSEEDAKIRWIVPLLEEFGHDRNLDMAFEVPVTWQAGTTTQSGFADIVVYVDEIPILMVETKRPGQSLAAARDQAVTYAKSFSPIVPFVLVHDRSRVVLYRASASVGRVGEYVVVGDFPTRTELLDLLGWAAEAPATVPERKAGIERVIESAHYRSLLQECARIVLAGGGVEGVHALAELGKVLLTKSYHETTQTGRFRAGASSNTLFNQAKTGFPGLFRTGERIELDRATFDALATRLAEVEVAASP